MAKTITKSDLLAVAAACEGSAIPKYTTTSNGGFIFDAESVAEACAFWKGMTDAEIADPAAQADGHEMLRDWARQAEMLRLSAIADACKAAIGA